MVNILERNTKKKKRRFIFSLEEHVNTARPATGFCELRAEHSFVIFLCKIQNKIKLVLTVSVTKLLKEASFCRHLPPEEGFLSVMINK